MTVNAIAIELQGQRMQLQLNCKDSEGNCNSIARTVNVIYSGVADFPVGITECLLSKNTVL